MWYGFLFAPWFMLQPQSQVPLCEHPWEFPAFVGGSTTTGYVCVTSFAEKVAGPPPISRLNRLVPWSPEVIVSPLDAERR